MEKIVTDRSRNDVARDASTPSSGAWSTIIDGAIDDLRAFWKRTDEQPGTLATREEITRIVQKRLPILVEQYVALIQEDPMVLKAAVPARMESASPHGLLRRIIRARIRAALEALSPQKLQNPSR